MPKAANSHAPKKLGRPEYEQDSRRPHSGPVPVHSAREDGHSPEELGSGGMLTSLLPPAPLSARHRRHSGAAFRPGSTNSGHTQRSVSEPGVMIPSAPRLPRLKGHGLEGFQPSPNRPEPLAGKQGSQSELPTIPPHKDDFTGFGLDELILLRREAEALRLRLATRDARIRELECILKETQTGREHTERARRSPATRDSRREPLETNGREKSARNSELDQELLVLRQRVQSLENQLDEARQRQSLAEQTVADLGRQLQGSERARLELAAALNLARQERDQSRFDLALAAQRLTSMASSESGTSRGRTDDLRAVKGVGPAFEKALHELGITLYEQVAAWTDEDILEMARRLRTKPERISRDGWVQSARELAAEKQRRGPPGRSEP